MLYPSPSRWIGAALGTHDSRPDRLCVGAPQGPPIISFGLPETGIVKPFLGARLEWCPLCTGAPLTRGARCKDRWRPGA